MLKSAMAHPLNLFIEPAMVLQTYVFMQSSCLETSVYNSKHHYGPVVLPYNIVLAANKLRPSTVCLTVHGIKLTSTTPNSKANQANLSARGRGFAKAQTYGREEYGNRFERAKSRDGTMEENELNAVEMIAQIGIQLVCSKCSPSFRHISHASLQRIPALLCKSFNSWLNRFQT